MCLWPRTLIAVTGFHLVLGSTALAFSNDKFENAVMLGEVDHASGSLEATGRVTVEHGDLMHSSGFAHEGSVWWRWTAPADGVVVFKVTVHHVNGGSAPATFIVLGRGDTFGDIALVAESVRKDVVGRVAAGNDYAFSAWFNPDTAASLTYELRLLEGTHNDSFHEAIDLGSGDLMRLQGNLSFATLEPNEPLAHHRASVWYRWQAPFTGELVVQSEDSLIPNRRPQRFLYAGAMLRTLAPVPRESGRYKDRFQVESGEIYHLALTTSGLPSPPDLYTVYLYQSGHPTNASFLNAKDLGEIEKGLEWTRFGDEQDTAWWQWTSPRDGRLYVDFQAPDIRGEAGEVQLFKSDTPAPDQEIIGFADGVSFEVVAGTKYYIAATNAPNVTDTIATLSVELGSTQALVHGGKDNPISLGSDRALTYDGTSYGSRGVLWHEWIAPFDGALSLSLTGGGNLRLSVFSKQTESPPEQTPFRVPVNADEAYWIRLEEIGYNGPSGYKLKLESYSKPENDDFDGARDLGSQPFVTFECSTYGATLDAAEQALTQARKPLVWFNWTAPEDVYLDFDPKISSIDFHVIRNGNPDQPLPNDYYQIARGELVHIGVEMDPSRHILVELITRNMTWRPPGDTFEEAIELGDAFPTSNRTSTFNSTVEAGEPPLDGVGEEDTPGTLWWRWRAPADLRINVHMGFSSNLSMWTGNQLDQLILTGSSDGSSATFEVAENQQYYIRSIMRDVSNRNERTIQLSVADRNDIIVIPETIDLGAHRNVEWVLSRAQIGFNETVEERFVWKAPEAMAIEIGGPIESISNGEGEFLSEGTPLTVEAGEMVEIITRRTLQTNPSALTLEQVPQESALNDSIFAAIELRGDTLQFEVLDGLITVDADETRLRSGPVVWWKWQVPYDGVLRLTDGNASALKIYEGDEINRLRDRTHVRTWDDDEYLLVKQGSTYYFAYEETFSLPRPFIFELRSDAPNDHFENRTTLPSKDLINFETCPNYATLEPEELERFPVRRNKSSVWWEWTAPSDGIYRLTNHRFDHEVSVYQGADFASMTMVASPRHPDVHWFAMEGETYVIALVLRQNLTSHSSPAGCFRLELSRTDLSFINGAFANRMRLPSEMTVDIQVHDYLPVDPLAPGRSWYSWTAPQSGRFVFDAGDQREIAILQGTEESTLTMIASAAGVVAIDVASGETYHLRVDPQTPPSFFRLSIHEAVFANNDQFDSAVSLSGESGLVTSFVQGDSLSLGEPLPPDSSGAHGSLWWQWQAPRSAAVTFAATDSRVRPHLAVYEGASLDTLTRVADSDSFIRDHTVRFAAVQGKRYWIQALRERPIGGHLSLKWEMDTAPTPENDSWMSAAMLPVGDDIVLTTSLGGATAGDIIDSHNQAVWYEWMPQEGGVYVIDVEADFHPSLHLYTLNEAGTPEVVNRFFSGANLFVTPGERYLFAVLDRVEQRFPHHLTSDTEFTFSRTKVSSFDHQTWDRAMDLGSQTAVKANGVFKADHGFHWWTWTAPSDGLVWSDRSGFRAGAQTLGERAGEHSPYKVSVGERLYFAQSSTQNREASLNIAFEHYPENDAFARSMVLPSEEEVSFTIESWAATAEPDEPDPFTHKGGAQWWSWTAPRDGIYSIAPITFNSSVRLAVYESDDLRRIASGSRVFFPATGNTLYRFAFSSDSRSASREISLKRVADLRTNQARETSLPLQEGMTNSTIWMGQEANVPQSIAGTLTNEPRIYWWHWEATHTGQVAIPRSSSELRVFARSTGETVLANDKGFYEVIESEVYEIMVKDPHAMLASATVTRVPANDDFDHAEPLPGTLPIAVPFENEMATREYGEPPHWLPRSGIKTHWWKWIAPESGWVHFTCPSYAGVYIGDRLTEFTSIARTSGRDQFFEVEAGVLYNFAVAPIEGEAFTLRWLYPKTFAGWAEEFGVADQSLESDLDGDGASLLLEYLGTKDPNNQLSFPRYWLEYEDDHWVYRYLATPHAEDLDVSLEVSEDLERWETWRPDVDYIDETKVASMGILIRRAHFDAALSGRLFVRLRIALTEP